MDGGIRKYPDGTLLASSSLTKYVSSSATSECMDLIVFHVGMVGDTGFEPVTSCMSSMRSNQLS